MLQLKETLSYVGEAYRGIYYICNVFFLSGWCVLFLTSLSRMAVLVSRHLENVILNRFQILLANRIQKVIPGLRFRQQYFS